MRRSSYSPALIVAGILAFASVGGVLQYYRLQQARQAVLDAYDRNNRIAVASLTAAQEVRCRAWRYRCEAVVAHVLEHTAFRFCGRRARRHERTGTSDSCSCSSTTTTASAPRLAHEPCTQHLSSLFYSHSCVQRWL